MSTNVNIVVAIGEVEEHNLEEYVELEMNDVLTSSLVINPQIFVISLNFMTYMCMLYIITL